MKRSSATRSSARRSRRSSARRSTRKQRGGGHCGPADLLGTIHRFTKYWYNTLRRDAWWSAGQEGYYYSNRQNCENCYQAQTHTHIYKMDDLDANPNGSKKVYWSTKIDDKPGSKGETTMNYNDIASWLIELNEQIGAVFPCSKTA